MNTVSRVVVVGAGVYGAAVAASLVRRGAAVTVVDGAHPGGGTSGASFSWTNSCGKQPRAYHDLNVAGMEAHRKLAVEASHADWYHERGNLEWADDDAARERLRAKVADLLEYDYEAVWLSRAEALHLEPDMNPAALPDTGIAYFPREGWIQPMRMIAHLLAGAAAGGAEVVTSDPVTAIAVADATVYAVTLASGRMIAADAVVNCAGRWADRVAAMAGLTLPLRNTRGVLLYTSPVAVSVGRVVHAPRVHLRPDGGGRLVLHSHDIDGAVEEVEAGLAAVDRSAIDRLLAAGHALYPGMGAASVESIQVGIRPIPGDGLPVLGRALPLRNFHFAVSHSGATLSVHAGDLVAAEALGEAQDEALASFRFERLT